MTSQTTLIAGPTASGKSDHALRLAETSPSVIINADALQVYDCWSILSARPQPSDLALADHRLYGHVKADCRYSVGAWLRDVAPILREAHTKDLSVIVVGGTGLYFDALTNGLAHVPEIKPEVRAASQALLNSNELHKMIADLEASDPEIRFRIDTNNPMRVQRSWEVLTSTGRPLYKWQMEKTAPLVDGSSCEKTLINPPTEVLNERIEARFRKMVELGALEECRQFMNNGYDRNLPAARALGASQLISFLEGHVDLDKAIQDATIATRQFAKRQRTWLRNRMSDWNKI
ncbi:tRNA (adenosine(37)-N6)-dimethylallyltransferase MiaA [Amaricoccus tamworthensis]|uniref:tRNA (adenosine(37)-N6)-dimethylallyltransferase MiaA n=1 Tax=Amaricoccus tamworthensis TaxID=57002 RepID=UPI003C7C44A3